MTPHTELAAARRDPTAASLLAQLEDARSPDWVLAGVFADRLAELNLHRLERAVRWLLPVKRRRKGRWPQWATWFGSEVADRRPGCERLWRHYGGDSPGQSWWDVTKVMSEARAASVPPDSNTLFSRHASWGDAVADMETWLPPPS